MGSSGVGGIAHLAIEMFNKAADVKAIHVPYTGGGPAATDVLAGHTQSLAMDLAPLRAHIEAGKMRAIAVVGASRSIMLPNTPTAIEQGYRRHERRQLVCDRGAGGHAETHRRQAACRDRCRRRRPPRSRRSSRRSVRETMPMASPADFPPFLKRELDRWGEVVRAAGLEKK